MRVPRVEKALRKEEKVDIELGRMVIRSEEASAFYRKGPLVTKALAWATLVHYTT